MQEEIELVIVMLVKLGFDATDMLESRVDRGSGRSNTGVEVGMRAHFPDLTGLGIPHEQRAVRCWPQFIQKIRCDRVTALQLSNICAFKSHVGICSVPVVTFGAPKQKPVTIRVNQRKNRLYVSRNYG
jgi:hypothetical protein